MAIKIYNEIVQGSQEWLNLRKLKFTASKATEIMTAGAGLDTLVKELLQVYYSTGTYSEFACTYKNDAMQRGNDFEALARMVYEFETGNKVEEIGFVELDDYTGCSPDGFVNDDGLIEIKNHNDKVFLELILTEKIEKKYINQMQFQMYVTGRKYCDYMGFNPNFQNNFYLQRVLPDADAFIKIESGLAQGKEKIKALMSELDIKLQAGKS